jgi:similar to stage IV sporulation protein
LGVSLPVTVVRETRRPYTADAVRVSAEVARRQGEAILTAYLHSLVDGYGTVSSTLCTVREMGGVFRVTLTAECVEEIGQSVPIYQAAGG